MTDSSSSPFLSQENIRMKTDLYTKTVRTVIAVALIGIVVQNVSLTPTAHAQSGVADVRIVGITKPIRNPGFNWQPLPVDVTKVLSTGIPVSSKLPIGINVYKTFCVIGLANAEEPRHHCISVGFVHNPPEITVNAYGHRLSAIFRALSRKRSNATPNADVRGCSRPSVYPRSRPLLRASPPPTTGKRSPS